VGPAVLKAHIESAGFSCEVVDLNVKLYNEFKKHGDEDQFFEKDSAFRCRDVEKVDEVFGENYKKYKYVFDEWIDFFKEKNPKWIGLSLLTVMSSAVAIKLSKLIREHLPETKIVWGGAEVTRGRTMQYFEKGLIDHWISGDGEVPIVKLLNGDLDNNGIDDRPPFQLININEVLVPNYDDIEWNEYPFINQPKPAYITGSRGCVKRCDFCNVYEIWPQYVFRSGAHIANEIIQVKQKYDRTTFKFTDSLINGSMKAFREMLQILADYNKTRKTDDEKIRWHSQWIVRNFRQSPEEDYRLMKESGCYGLDVGVESFSQNVRFELGKKFTDDDMWWCFEMLQKYEIHHTLLMFVGHPFETDADHQITLQTIRQLYEKGYAGKKTDEKRLMYISMANTMMLSDDTPVWNKVKDELEYWHNDWNWKFRDNTLEVRLRRLEEANDLLSELAGQERSWMVRKKIEMIKKSFG
jgi:radical SAM superfamily enzyme YgiQ (UPF0313 family)